MKDYQEKYIANLKEIFAADDVNVCAEASFDAWYSHRKEAEKRIEELRQENIALINDELFPVLDDLFNADEKTIGELKEFASKLMDWSVNLDCGVFVLIHEALLSFYRQKKDRDKTIEELKEFASKLMDWSVNLDCGVYVLIHEALLSFYRQKKDRDKTIEELYQLGMGLYYLNRMVQGSDHPLTRSLSFEDMMFFTEAGSYLKYFPQIENEETKGYIIRALANVSIATKDRKIKLNSSSKVLNIITDPYYQELAPNLPWQTYQRRTYQQISSIRNTLSRGDFTNEELGLIMEACQVVFEPEKDNAEPNVRWLWPYYEMEYNCGFADLKTTLDRMEKLIEDMPYDRYDQSGLYANVQLPSYYGRLLRDNPQLLEKKRYVEFLDFAYRKMMKTLLTIPKEYVTDYYSYTITLVCASYFETPGVRSYYEVTSTLMARLTGSRYIHSRRIGEILQLYTKAIIDHDPSFFDELPFLNEIEDEKEKEKELLNYAKQCGTYYDFGRIPMNIDKTIICRDLFDREYRIYTLHTDIGYHCLQERESTARFADVALGHHKHYEGEGYPQEYKRLDSPYRSFTDLAAIVSYLRGHEEEDIDHLCENIQKQSRTIFSPILTSYLDDKDLRKQIKTILTVEKRKYYKELYDQLHTH